MTPDRHSLTNLQPNNTVESLQKDIADLETALAFF